MPLGQDLQTLTVSRAVGAHISEGRTDTSICNSVIVALRAALCCPAHVEGPVPSPLILPPHTRLLSAFAGKCLLARHSSPSTPLMFHSCCKASLNHLGFKFINCIIQPNSHRSPCWGGSLFSVTQSLCQHSLHGGLGLQGEFGFPATGMCLWLCQGK